MNSKSKKSLPAWLPFLVGTVLVVQFAALGAWQISRGLEKRATQQAYQDESSFTQYRSGMDVRSYQRLQASGHYKVDRQVLLDNIIVNSRYGYYVITPLAIRDEPLLLVNRGWIQKNGNGADKQIWQLPDLEISVRGRAGSLPRAGMKMGDSFAPQEGWPKKAVFPTLDDVATALEQEVQPFVLLLDHEEPHGFYRHWVPSEFGPGKHFGYALQWFAMGAVLSGLLVWNYRKKRFGE